MKNLDMLKVEDAVRNLLQALGEDYTNAEIAEKHRKDFNVSYVGMQMEVNSNEVN